MISIKEEPLNESYRGLLKLAARYSCEFRLVTKLKTQKPGVHAAEVLDRLRPFLIDEKPQSKWAGTTTLGDPVPVARYRLEAASMAILEEADGLYAWMLPDLPEDLSFYLADGSCFLSSTAHESEAMLRLGSVTTDEFERSVPGVPYKWFPGSRP